VLWVSLFSDLNRWLVLIIFLLASLTDLVDGWWARRHGLVSNFGKIADPIADKALTGAAWIGLSILGDIPWIATFLILFREIGITIIRLWIVDSVVIAASKGGKLKTTMQIVTISFFIVFASYDIAIISIGLALLLWVSVAITSVTGWNYFTAMKPFLKSRQK
jgi:CDP-diacylglycerol--glycerol-3-phosphate 3-phosphatidyltransferase